MEGSQLGIWIAHGQGNFQNVDDNINIPLQYTDDDFNEAPIYPFNQNGSKNAIAGLCYKDGIHYWRLSWNLFFMV